MSSLITIVNEKDEIIGYKQREDIDHEKDIYRVTALWIKNSDNEVLLAQRAFAKKNSPGLWGPAVAGTVEKGETYESNIYKEAQEEIGLSGVEFLLGPKNRTREKNTYRNYFAQWFFATVNEPASFFTVRPGEVEQVAWISSDKLVEDAKRQPTKYIPSMQKIINTFVLNNK